MSAKKPSKRTLAKAREMLAICQNVEADPQMRAAVRSAMEQAAPAPQRAPEEVAARLRVLRWAAREASNKFDCFDDFEEAVRVAYQPHNIPSYADEISAALRDLCRWAADGADPETAAALEAAAGEMSKD